MQTRPNKVPHEPTPPPDETTQLVLFIVLSVWEGMSPEQGGQQGLFLNLKPAYLQTGG